jgi:hypothetical protein
MQHQLLIDYPWAHRSWISSEVVYVKSCGMIEEAPMSILVVSAHLPAPHQMHHDGVNRSPEMLA